MEDRFIARLRREIEANPALNDRLVRGMGDDAAILKRFRGEMAVTTDLLCDGVDFQTEIDSPRAVGRKALAVNLSDLAAMGALPLSVVVSLLLPQRIGRLRNLKQAHDSESVTKFALEFYRGMIPLAERFHVSLAGGDTNSWSGKFAVSVTALGAVSARKALLRGGTAIDNSSITSKKARSVCSASSSHLTSSTCLSPVRPTTSGPRPGDRILVTGPLGGSIFGRQFTFTPRVAEALYLNRHYKIHAAMDISDGLVIDLSRMAREGGVGFLLDEKSVPIHPDVLAPPKNSRCYPGWEHPRSPLDHAMEDGEDFELILAVSPREAKRLLAEQPFLAMANEAAVESTGTGRKTPKKEKKGRETEFDLTFGPRADSALTKMKTLCDESQFPFSPDDFSYSDAACLTDVGLFTPPEAGLKLKDAQTGEIFPADRRTGWSYRF